MDHLINKLKSDIFFRRYAIYFTGSMIVAFLNYLFYPVLGRLLSSANFGDVQALVSLITQSGIILGAFSMVVVNITNNAENHQERDKIISELQKIALWIVGAVFVLLLLSISGLKSFFHFSSIYPLVGLAVILPISALIVFRNAFLLGSGRFKNLSVSGIISSLGRLVLAIGFIYMGMGVLGATLGIVIANLFVLAYLFNVTRGSLHLSAKSNVHVLEKGSVSKELIYGVLVLFATSIVAIYSTSDILTVKHYFNATDAGLYAGISVISNLIYFAISPCASVLLSSVKIKQTFKENAVALKKSFIITLVVGGLGLFTFNMFCVTIVKLMIGSKYAPFAHFLPQAGLVMFLVAIANIFIYYFLALRRFFLVAISLVGIILMGSVFIYSHSSIGAVLNGMAMSLAVIIVLLTTIYAKDYFNYRSRI